MAQMPLESRTNSMPWRYRLPYYLLIVGILWFLITFLLNPIFTVLKDTFWLDGQFTSDAVSKIMRSKRALQAIQNSVILAVVLTFTINLVGTFIVLATEYFQVKGAAILRVGFMSTLVFSGIVLNNGYLYVYGAQGVLTKFLMQFFPDMNANWFTGFGAVVFVMTFACTSNHM